MKRALIHAAAMAVLSYPAAAEPPEVTAMKQREASQGPVRPMTLTECRAVEADAPHDYAGRLVTANLTPVEKLCDRFTKRDYELEWARRAACPQTSPKAYLTQLDQNRLVASIESMR